MTFREADIPLLVERFLKTGAGRGAEPVLCRLHSWMEAKRLTIFALDPPTLDLFLKNPFRKTVTTRTATLARRGLIAYLNWLYQQGYTEYGVRGSMALRHRPLTSEALAFLDALAPTHRRRTCDVYRICVRHFCTWLYDSRLSLKRLRRSHMEQWLLGIHDRKLHPSTQTHELIRVRVYLRWLAEHRHINVDPDDLIRSSDLPKLPSYLPRPLPPAVDRELQQRLATTHDRRWWGLLLMRHTGLRIGELLALEFDCVRQDPQGYSLLKVPLGKLNSERLVPLTEQALKLIERLQTQRPLPHTHLLERRPGQPQRYQVMSAALREASEGLDGNGPITSHRLRHTYATTLMAGGMGIVGIMKLLGHRDFRMTLRYTAITQKVLGREYRSALKHLETKYGADLTPHVTDDEDALTAVTDALKWMQHREWSSDVNPRLVRSLTRRLCRIQADLRTLKNNGGE